MMYELRTVTKNFNPKTLIITNARMSIDNRESPTYSHDLSKIEKTTPLASETLPEEGVKISVKKGTKSPMPNISRLEAKE